MAMLQRSRRVFTIVVTAVTLAALVVTMAGPTAAGGRPPTAGVPGDRWKSVTPNNTGIPGDYVYSLAIDARDRVWATGDDPVWDQGGLGIFDGRTWHDYTNVDQKAPTHEMGHVQFDALGRGWMGSPVGLLAFDGKRVKKIWSMANAPWPTNQVTDFDWDSQGNLWVGLADVKTVLGGLAKYDGVSWTVYTTANGLPWAEPWDHVSAVEIDAQDRVWIGSDVMGGAMFDGTTWKWLGVEGSWVSDIAIARDGTPWYGFMSLGVFIWNGTRWIDRTGPFGTMDISAVTLDRNGKIWISTFIGSIWRYSGGGWGLSYDIPSLSHVYGLAFDSQNRPWAGGIGGMAMRQTDGTWVEYTTMNTALTSRWIEDIMVDSHGVAWFSTSGGGVAAFDGSVWSGFNPANWGWEPWPFPTDSAHQTVEDGNGTIWSALTFSGVGEWDGTTWVHHLPNADIQAVGVDATGAVWAAPGGGEVKRWNGSTWVGMGNPRTIDLHAVTGDAQGNVWLSSGSGLEKWDGTRWTVYETQNSGLPSNSVYDVAPEPSGDVVWIATGAGLARFDGTTWTVYDESNSQIPADETTEVEVAPNGTVWVSAFQGSTWPYYGGLGGFDGTSWRVYTAEDSPLPHNQIWGLEVDTAGNVWVGTASEAAAILRPGP
jgi:ligand-binding sensor domain-containing protein